MTEAFFDKLSYRFRSENDLSDITWTLGESCPLFQQLFLKFFFIDLPDTPKIDVFKREHIEDDCRPDFYIKSDAIEYIIECKIYDRNHHFEQYKYQFPKAKFGYITNYPMTFVDGDFVIKQWKDFKNYLINALADTIDDQSKNLISGYIKYLTNVWGIFNLKKMNLTNLSSLYYFNELIKKIVSSLEDRETSLYNQGKSFDISRSGQYFSLKINDSETIYPWLGVYYSDRICIYFEFNWKWCRRIFDTIEAKEIVDGEFYCAPDYDEDYGSAYCFELKESYFNLFNSDTTTVEDQENIIRSFIKEVLASIGL